MIDISNPICQAAATVASAILKEASFDKTVVCEVVQQIEGYTNKYLVTNGSVSFQAITTDPSRKYLDGQQVYVTIPNGDYSSADKLIIGSYSAEEELPKNLYTQPFDHLVASKKVDFGNNITTSEVEIDNINFYYKNETPLTYLGLELSLDTTEVTKEYWFEVWKDNDDEKALCTFKSSEMPGNPYNYVPFIKLQRLYEFTEDLNISKLKLKVGGDTTGLIVNSAIVYFGYDKDALTANKLSLHLDKGENLEFSNNDKRNLYIEWQDNDNKKEYNETQILGSDVYLFKYVPGYKKTFADDIEQSGTYWKTIEKGIAFNYTVDLDPNYNTQQYKAGLIIDDVYYESDPIIFINQDVQAEPGATNSSEDSIKLTCSDSGVYNYYNSYGQIIDNSYLRKERTITAEFLDGYKIADAESVEWTFPKSNTMISRVIKEEETKGVATFRLLDNYIPGIKDDNTIYCTAILSSGEIRRGKITLRFGDARNSGSNYSFNINFTQDSANCFTAIESELQIQASLERLDGEIINNKPDIDWELMEGDFVTTIFNKDNYVANVTLKTMPIEGKNHIVLVATIKDYTLDNGLTSDLIAYLPIPIGSSGYSHITGPTKLIYNSAGNALESYSKESYQLIKSDGAVEKETIIWEIETLDNAPKLKEKNKLYFLQPLAQAPDEMPIVCLTAKKNDIVVWQQPILSLKDRYLSNWLNDWNGGFKINEEENYLMTASVAAGTKKDNKFSGVTIGELREVADKTISTTGLFGFDEGVIRFYLNREGEFFVGDEETNFISFKEEKNKKVLTIKTNTFILETDKLKINNTGITFYDKEDKVLFNLDASTNTPTATIAGWNFKYGQFYCPYTQGSETKYTGIAIGGQTTGAFYAGADDTQGNNAVFLVDHLGNLIATSGSLANWTITKNQLYCSRAGINNCGAGAAFWAGEHRAGDNTGNETAFRVWHDGRLEASSANITGAINATSGSFGGWEITGDSITHTAAGMTIALTTNTALPAFYVTQSAWEDSLFRIDWSGNVSLKGTLSAGSIINYSSPAGTTKIGTLVVNNYDNVGTQLDHVIPITSSLNAHSSLYLANSGFSLSSCNVSIGVNVTYPDTNPTDYKASGVLAGGIWRYNSAEIATRANISDISMKHDIRKIDEKYSDLFNELEPVSFIYNNKYEYGTSQRTHIGFIANDVKKTMDNNNISSQEFAGYVELTMDDGQDMLALNYEEFIALNTWQIQKLKSRVAELEQEIKEIKNNATN